MSSARASSVDDNVRVFCRFRPLNAMEQQLPLCVSFEGCGHVVCKMPQTPRTAIQQPSCVSSASNDGGSFSNIACCVDEFSYSFSRVYEPDTSQEQLYEDVARPIVDDVMHGYNGTLLAYGQTGSGKTHTMFGFHLATSGNSGSSLFSMNDENGGIAPRAVRQLFSSIYAAENTAEFEIRAQFIEVYMERIRDLLNPASGNLHLREDSSGFYVENCEMPYVANAQEVLKLLHCALHRRVTTVTASNEVSSRSHCVVCITVKKVDKARREAVMGKLFLVDLAGSEKVSKTLADGLQLAEAKLINRSLTTLGHVIMSLTEKQAHVPYRDSKLTQILKDSLGGNSRTALIVCCSPSQLNVYETASSLRFGARAQNVRNRAVVNRQPTLEDLRSMLDFANSEIERLQQLLRQKENETDALSQSVFLSFQPAEASEKDAGNSFISESMGSKSVEDLLQQGGHEQLPVEGDMQGEVNRLRNALRDAEKRAELFCTQSATQASLLQSLQQECVAWEEDFIKITREMHKHRSSAAHYRSLLQEAQDEASLMPSRLLMYVEKLRAIREMMTKHFSRQSDKLTLQLDSAVPLNENKLSLTAFEMSALRSLESDKLSSEQTDHVIRCNSSHNGDNNNKNNNFGMSKCNALLNCVTALMSEVEDLRKTNGALALELQLVHKKLGMRNTRIESLKHGFRKESADRLSLQSKLDEERVRFREEIQKAKSDALHWRQCYEDLLNNCHIINCDGSAWRTDMRRKSTPELETAFLLAETRLASVAPMRRCGGAIVKAVRGGGESGMGEVEKKKKEEEQYISDGK